MTTQTPEAPSLEDIFNQPQIVRAAAVQVARDALVFGVTRPSHADIIDLADYIVGDDPEPFEIVLNNFIVEATKPAEQIAECPFRETCAKAEEPIVGEVTVHDEAGIEALPLTATLRDQDGDVWDHRRDGWGFGVAEYPAEEMAQYGPLVVTNPEVLGQVGRVVEVEKVVEPELTFVSDVAGLDALPFRSVVVAPRGQVYVKTRDGRWHSPEVWGIRHSQDIAEAGPALVAYIAGNEGFRNEGVCK